MPNKHSPCIINLDDYQSQGTRWVACTPSYKNKKILWYFDSFGKHYPTEYENRAKKDGMKVIYKRVPYFFLSLREGGILQILQSDWFRERAVFYDLAR